MHANTKLVHLYWLIDSCIPLKQLAMTFEPHKLFESNLLVDCHSSLLLWASDMIKHIQQAMYTHNTSYCYLW